MQEFSTITELLAFQKNKILEHTAVYDLPAIYLVTFKKLNCQTEFQANKLCNNTSKCIIP
jgi:hypothetical protein